jgi:hypothetical protein
MEFQGLPISIENRKGSKRYWTDPNNGKDGSTKMQYPYGYIRGTLSTDDDAVDVYIGKDEKSDKAFVITQMKTPDFKEIDEQKVMLGFSSAEKAKLAYLAHYDDPRFFKEMKELSMGQFRAKLATHKGKLIKGALLGKSKSATISGGTMKEPHSAVERGYSIDEKDMDLKKRFKSEAQRKHMHAAADRGELSRDVVEEFSDKTPKDADLPERVKKKKSMTTASEDLKDVNKALTASLASSIARRARMVNRVHAYEAAAIAFGARQRDFGVPESVGIAQEQPAIGTARETNLAEPPVVPVRMLRNDVSQTLGDAEVFKSCVSCGRMSKSLACLSCSIRQLSEARPLWRR